MRPGIGKVLGDVAEFLRPSRWWRNAAVEPESPRRRLLGWVLFGVEAVFLAIFPALEVSTPMEVAVFSIVPIGLAAWFFGKPWGFTLVVVNVAAFVTVEEVWVRPALAQLAAEELPWTTVMLAVAYFVAELGEVTLLEARGARELRRSAQLLDRTLEGADTAIAYYDAEGRLLHANRAYLAAHGATLENVRGKTHLEAFGIPEPPDIPIVARTREPQTASEIELPCMAPRGERKFWDWRVDPVTIDNDRGVIVEARDVTRRHELRVAAETAATELRENAERFRQIADNVSDVLFLTTPDLRQVLYVNPAYEELTGVPTAAFVADPNSWVRLFSAEDQIAVERSARERLARGEPDELNVTVHRPDGATREVLVRSFPVKDEHGRIVRFVGVVKDMTREREARAAEVREILHEREIAHLNQVAAFKTQFLNNAAHELASPITPLQFELKSLREGYAGNLTSEQRESIDILTRTVDRVTVLVSDLLDAARLESGRLRLRLADVDLGALARECVKPFERLAADARIALVVEAPGGVIVHADPTRVTQVLTNLVDNAIRYTPECGRVEVRASADADEARLVVRDSGRGLTPEQIAKLFQPFSQVQPTGPYRGNQGSGLGLFISKGIIEAQGGRIWCESAGAGLGSAFSLALPLRRESPAPPKREAGAAVVA